MVAVTGRIRLKVRRKLYTLLSLDLLDSDDDDRTATGRSARLMVRVNKQQRQQQEMMIHPLCLFLRAVVRVHYYYSTTNDDDDDGDDDCDPSSSSNNEHPIVAWSITLIECPPSPIAVQMVLKDPHLWSTLLPPPPPPQQEQEQEDWDHPTHALVQTLVARLERRTTQSRRPRLQRVRRRDIERLEAEERNVGLVELRSSSSTNDSSAAAVVGWNLPVPATMPSAHHQLTRGEYLQTKKHPQIHWCVQRLLRTFRKQHRTSILDVGGGRGDLAVALAVADTNVHVTVVDSNPRALQAAQTFAARNGVHDRVHTVGPVDFAEFDPATTSTQFDLVVALHACGDLSDAAIQFAVDRRIPFLVCPCCFGKLSQQQMATRMAEWSQRPAYSRRGMHVVNSQRCRRLLDHEQYCVVLEEYDRAWSSRNQVLLGWPEEYDMTA